MSLLCIWEVDSQYERVKGILSGTICCEMTRDHLRVGTNFESGLRCSPAVDDNWFVPRVSLHLHHLLAHFHHTCGRLWCLALLPRLVVVVLDDHGVAHLRLHVYGKGEMEASLAGGEMHTHNTVR